MPAYYRTMIEKILSPIEVEINGNNPWDIQIHNPKTYRRIIQGSSVGAGESYMDAWWDCEQLDELFFRVTRYLDPKNIYNTSISIWALIKYFVANQQSLSRSKL